MVQARLSSICIHIHVSDRLKRVYYVLETRDDLEKKGRGKGKEAFTGLTGSGTSGLTRRRREEFSSGGGELMRRTR